MSIIGKASDSTFDYSDWIQKDGQTRNQIISSILNSITVSESYEAFPGYRSNPDSYVIDIKYDSDTNTFEFIFNDGNNIVITINSNGDVDLSEYVTKQYLDNKITELSSDTQWKSSVPTFKELSKRYPNPQDGWTANVDDTDITYRYTGTEWIPISSNSIPLATNEVDGKMSKEDKSKLDSLSNYDDSSIKKLVDQKVDKIDGKSLSTNDFTNELKDKLELLENYDDSDVLSELNKSVKYSEFDNGRKTIQLNNYDTISGITTSGDGVNIAMVSKWDKVDLGSSKIEINLNGLNKRPTYNDSDEIALINDLNSIGVYSLGKVGSFNDIPLKLSDKTVCTNANNTIITFVVSNSTYGDEGGICRNIYTQGVIYQTMYWKNTVQKRKLTVLDGEVQPSEFEVIDDTYVFLPNRAINGIKLFSLTTSSSSEDIKSAMTSTIHKIAIDSSDLDQCITKGFMIKEEVVGGHIMVGWNGSAYTFTQVGLTSPKSDPSIKSVIINVTPEGVYSVVKNGFSSIIMTKSSVSPLLDSKVDKIEGKSLINDNYIADIPGLMSRINILESRISEISKTNVESGTISGSDLGSYNDSSKDYILTGSINTGDLTVSSKSITLNNLEVTGGSRVKLTADKDIDINSMVISGDFPKSGGNTIVKSNESDYVTIKNSVIDATSYNVIEIGLDGDKLPKVITIDGCDFKGTFTNNAILIFGTQDNAVININNCHFNSISNAVRLSNRTNTKCTVNITNCTVDKWDSNLDYSGLMIFQDYTSESPDETNLFSPDKITINISNLTIPGGKKLVAPKDMSTICGSRDENQVFYVYRDTGSSLVPYGDGSSYPTINIL